MTTTDTFVEDQYRTVYAGIAAVAAKCDGAVDDDGVGFNGQDTKFGRRIAAIPFDQWTDEIKVEAARISARYRRQIEQSLGLDITTQVDVIRAALALNDMELAKKVTAALFDSDEIRRVFKQVHMLYEARGAEQEFRTLQREAALQKIGRKQAG